MDKSTLDEKMMRRCLALAKSAEGRSSPNPMVGAVLLDNEGRLATEGFHAKAGQAHAEIIALEKAGQSATGGTLYVNLEPCSHYGRTPPCADRVIASGIKRVVVGMQDPNPQVCGQGIAKLQAAGIVVEFSKLEQECRELNRAFIKRMLTGLPWLSLKMASTLDGRIADREGNSRWITGAESRKFVHQLRNTYDCVLIGSGTALADDPELNVRDIENSRDPHRAVIDTKLKVSPGARLCRHSDNSESWTVIFASSEKIKGAAAYPDRVRLVAAEPPDGESKPTVLRQALAWLAQNDIQSVLCEGGGGLAAALLEENLVDEAFWIIAPKMFVDSAAVPALSGKQRLLIDSCLEFEDLSYRQLGTDMLVHGRLSIKTNH